MITNPFLYPPQLKQSAYDVREWYQDYVPINAGIEIVQQKAYPMSNEWLQATHPW